jgi:hypothetical protein
VQLRELLVVRLTALLTVALVGDDDLARQRLERDAERDLGEAIAGVGIGMMKRGATPGRN